MYTKKDRFTKFPNDFFYDNGNILKQIGGKDSFLLYSFLTSRKTALNTVHVTIKDIINNLKLDKNVSRSKNRVVKALELLKLHKYIDYTVNMLDVKITDTVAICYVDRFEDGEIGWIPFYAGDFEIYYKVGTIPYIISWILRMYVNHYTNTSFISIGDMSSALQCSNSSIQNSINLFKSAGLFDVNKGDYYFHPEFKQKIRYNNTYKYNYNINSILNMSDKEVGYFLKRK